MTRSTGTFVHRALERASAGAAAIALTLFALVSVDARAAGSQTTSASMKVAYSEAAITSTSGAAEVYRKLKRAARKVCDPDTGPRTLQVHAAISECIDAALADAVRKIDRPKLTALHAAETRSLG